MGYIRGFAAPFAWTSAGIDMTFLEFGIGAVERGLVPDSITRRAIRNLCVERLKNLSYDREDRVVLADRKSTRLNSSHIPLSRMPSSA